MSAGGTAATNRDSVGIRVVENLAPGADALPVVTVASEPLLVLGKLDGPAVEQFGRLVEARLLSDAVVVLDAQNHRLVLFGLDGSLRRSIGHEGEGPGDMRRVNRLLSVAGDSLVVWDYQLLRATTFDTAGAVVALVTLPRGELREEQGVRYTVNPNPLVRLTDGRFVAASSGGMRINPPSGVHHDSLVYSLVDSTGVTDSLTQRAAGVNWSYETPRHNIWFDSLAYAPRAADAFTDSVWYRIEGDRFEITERDWTGAPQRLIRSLRVRRPVTDADRARFTERAVAAEGPENMDELKPIYDWMPYPDSMPAYDQLVVDATGMLWARVFPDTASLATWDLFDADGLLAGTARMRSDLEVRDISVDRLLAQTTGEAGEHLVMLYQLTRAGP